MGSTRQTIRAYRYVNNLLKYPSKYQARVAAGYSSSYALTGQIDQTVSVKKAMASIVDNLEKERDRLIQNLSETVLGDVEYRDKVNALDKIQKNIQLLSGRPTDNIALTDLKNLSDEELEELIQQGSSGTSKSGESETFAV